MTRSCFFANEVIDNKLFLRENAIVIAVPYPNHFENCTLVSFRLEMKEETFMVEYVGVSRNNIK